MEFGMSRRIKPKREICAYFIDGNLAQFGRSAKKYKKFVELRSGFEPQNLYIQVSDTPAHGTDSGMASDCAHRLIYH